MVEKYLGEIFGRFLVQVCLIAVFLGVTAKALEVFFTFLKNIIDLFI